MALPRELELHVLTLYARYGKHPKKVYFDGQIAWVK